MGPDRSRQCRSGHALTELNSVYKCGGAITVAGRKVKIWYDPEGDYLEVIFDQKPGFYRETASEQVMEKVDEAGNMLGFSVIKVSALTRHLWFRCTTRLHM